MGLFSRLLGGQTGDRLSREEILLVAPEASDARGPGLSVISTDEVAKLQQVVGPTTFCRPHAQQVALALLRDHDGYLEDVGTLEHVAADDQRPEALDVIYQGHWIGALAGHATDRVNLPIGAQVGIPVQLCAAQTAKGPRLDAWAWLGDDAPQWEYSAEHRPPVTAKERSGETAFRARTMVREALVEGGQRGEDFVAGSEHGIHYLETVGPIEQLKREGQLEAALKLCYIAIEGAEGDARFGEPAPWYTIQAAIIHRKLKQREEEIAVLQRWLDHCPAEDREGSGVQKRLAKLLGPGRSS
ncbi:Tetratricopeptide repeat protein [Corynebacterium falsenii]|uniref:Uncharacterized protein n=3 Tax=Propionibacteriaceae TaxID=31957 RepID=A0A1H9U4B0_9ACTN|nr:hypothetical protein [Propionibacterium cyclohexanicum]SES03913.1 hypothetical protein SAMN05443377_13717 [Propionibacterium cyclohexanicum]